MTIWPLESLSRVFSGISHTYSSFSFNVIFRSPSLSPLSLSLSIPSSIYPLRCPCRLLLLLLLLLLHHFCSAPNTRTLLRKRSASTSSTLQIGSMQIDNILTNDTLEAERNSAARAEAPRHRQPGTPPLAFSSRSFPASCCSL